MRLIDADALQNKIQKSKMKNPHKDAKVAKNHEIEHDHFMRMVTLQPTAQEEIVRCKNCKFAKKQIGSSKEHEYKCMLSEDEGLYDYYDREWYCPYGERKDKNA